LIPETGSHAGSDAGSARTYGDAIDIFRRPAGEIWLETDGSDVSFANWFMLIFNLLFWLFALWFAGIAAHDLSQAWAELPIPAAIILSLLFPLSCLFWWRIWSAERRFGLPSACLNPMPARIGETVHCRVRLSRPDRPRGQAIKTTLICESVDKTDTFANDTLWSHDAELDESDGGELHTTFDLPWDMPASDTPINHKHVRWQLRVYLGKHFYLIEIPVAAGKFGMIPA
jgi:hypothetical protein